MMFTLPSARRLLLPISAILTVLILLRLLSETGISRSSQKSLLEAAVQRHVSRASITVFNKTTHPHLFEKQKFTSTSPFGFEGMEIPRVNPVVRQFMQCPIAVNPWTGHMRLENVVLNISLVPSRSSGVQKRAGYGLGDSHEEERPRFFNPAFIPLPYWSHPARYILVSRMVTAGFHQESHICLADTCHPPETPDQSPRRRHSSPHRPSADTRVCTSSDLHHLGSQGGMRCLTQPLKINIPPTPAEKCEGAWLAFPDIPGFHDPRGFWSGKGEPLILVNSASRYGCVGLWIVDLRKVVPLLEGVLGREGRGKLLGLGLGKRAGAHDTDVGEEEEVVSTRGIGSGLKPSMSYPHLTELTRNPRSSRASVEKNWVLWFPRGDEAYVQYDMMGHRVVEQYKAEHDLGQDIWGLERIGMGGNLTQMHGLANGTNNATGHINSTMWSSIKSTRRNEIPRQGGRTFAKLTGNGFTTPNLTHSNEEPCFSSVKGHFKDSLSQTGHWHQGSNSLRLILCTRAQARNNPNCRDDEFADLGRNDNRSAGAVTSGLSVHFAVMHRKFSNELELPLRYERYVVVWEGRAPFQVLGVSRFPLLMKNEWARPWTEEENWPEMSSKGGWNASAGQAPGINKNNVVRREIDGSDIADKTSFDKSSAYFTYTPSLTWAWRPHSTTANQEEEEDDIDYMSQLGTGYLGDEVLVGIGMDDVSQGFARVKVETLLQCLRLCPGVKFAEGDAE